MYKWFSFLHEKEKKRNKNRVLQNIDVVILYQFKIWQATKH